MTQPVSIAITDVPVWQTQEVAPGVGGAMAASGAWLFGGAVVSNPGAAAEALVLYDTGPGQGAQLAAVSVPAGGTVPILAPWPGVAVRGGIWAQVAGADLVCTLYIAPLS